MIEANRKIARVFRPLLAPARYKGAYGGRASGKSHFFAEQLVFDHVLTPGLRSIGVREVQHSLKQSVRQLLLDKIAAHNLRSFFEVREAEIRSPGEGRINFAGMQDATAETIKSFEGARRAYVEEAQTISARSWSMLRPTIRAEGSEIWCAWNPRNDTDPIDEFFRRDPPPGSIAVQANYEDNPWLNQTILDEIAYDKRRDPDRYAHVWLGRYETRSAATVFRNWRVEWFETPSDARFYHGADWGFSIDPTVLIRCFMQDRTLFIDREVSAIGCEIDDLPALFAGSDRRDPPRWSNRHGRLGIETSRDWPIIADSARPETISYMRRLGFKIEPAAKGRDSVREGVEWLRTMDIVVHPDCKRTIDELATYQWQTDRLTGEVLPKLRDEKNHVIDSLRYALEPYRRAAAKKSIYEVVR